jgi:hypothetical protein
VKTSKKPEPAACGVCGREHPMSQLVSVDHVHPEVARLIDKDKPDWRATGYVCRDDMLKYRHR